MKKFILKLNETTVKIIYYLDENILFDDKYATIERLAMRTPRFKDIGFGGYKTLSRFKYLIDFLVYSGDTKRVQAKKLHPDVVVSIIKNVLIKLQSVIGKRVLYIFIFPTFSEFIIKKLHGTSGYAQYKNTISIAIYPSNGWKKSLVETIAHEVAHILSPTPYYDNKVTLGESLIFEGLAEHFREYFFDGKRAFWTKVFSKKKAFELFNKEIRKHINKPDTPELHNAIFFGGKNIPFWAGYTIGYYLVREYIKNQIIIDWKKIIYTRPKKILNKSLQLLSKNV